MIISFCNKYLFIITRVMRKKIFGQYAGGGRRGFWRFFDTNLQKM
jgi:hypothetical protein